MSQYEILQEQANLNEALPGLGNIGINVYLGTYTAWRQVPVCDMDTGEFYLTGNTPFQEMQVAILVVSDASATHLMRRPNDVFKEEYRPPF